MRTFDFLWEGVVTALRESQHDTNAQSIRDDLRKGPQPSKKTNPDTKAAVAPKGAEKGKGDKKSTDKAKPDPKAKGQDKQKGKGKGSSKPSSPTPPKSIQQGGNPPPCIFYARGKCTRANCPFSHDAPATSAAAASTATPKAPAAQPKAKAVAAMVAYLCGLGPVMGMTTAVESDFSGYLDFIGDTGAGECLGSPEALKKQGLDVPSSCFTYTSSPMRFATGGGTQHGSTTVGCRADELKRLTNIYMLPQCTLALSIGQLCADGFSFVWPSGGHLPFLVPPTSSLHYDTDGPIIEAHRIEHHVPIFLFSTDLVPGMPCSSSGGECI